MRLRHACVYYKERNDEYQLQQQQQQQKVTTAIAQPTDQPTTAILGLGQITTALIHKYTLVSNRQYKN